MNHQYLPEICYWRRVCAPVACSRARSRPSPCGGGGRAVAAERPGGRSRQGSSDGDGRICSGRRFVATTTGIDAQVFVYVLQGALRMQVAGSPVVTLHRGQTFYENPTDVHVVSANASKSAPAKILVFIVKDKNAPVTRDVPAQAAPP